MAAHTAVWVIRHRVEVVERDPSKAFLELARYGRELADVREATQVLNLLCDACGEQTGCSAVAVFGVGDDLGTRLVASHALPPAVREACARLEGLDGGLDQMLHGRWEAAAFAESRSYVLVSGGGLFGALVAFWADPPPPWALAQAGALAELAALALDRAHQTDELLAVIEDLRASREQIARTEQLRVLGQMAAVVAHEVKNPLASIGGVMQILRGRLPAAADRDVVDRLLVRVGDLDALVTELLQFSRPRALEPAPVEVGAMLRDAVAAFSPGHPDMSVEVVADVEVVVSADPRQLRGVVQNLLQNAAQAAGGHGQIRVAVARGSECTIEVADDGPGIPEEIRGRIFEPFFTTRTHGTGLGLATTWRVVDAHGGRITVECPPGGGTVFRIALPLS